MPEVPTRGPDRLERKLSLDVHFLIPHFVKDQRRREQMTSIAQDLASRHGCRLARPDPPIWSKLLGWMFGSARSRRRPQDEENRGQEESLVEGVEKEKRKREEGGEMQDESSENLCAKRVRTVGVDQGGEANKELTGAV